MHAAASYMSVLDHRPRERDRSRELLAPQAGHYGPWQHFLPQSAGYLTHLSHIRITAAAVNTTQPYEWLQVPAQRHHLQHSLHDMHKLTCYLIARTVHLIAS